MNDFNLVLALLILCGIEHKVTNDMRDNPFWISSPDVGPMGVKRGLCPSNEHWHISFSPVGECYGHTIGRPCSTCTADSVIERGKKG